MVTAAALAKYKRRSHPVMYRTRIREFLNIRDAFARDGPQKRKNKYRSRQRLGDLSFYDTHDKKKSILYERIIGLERHVCRMQSSCACTRVGMVSVSWGNFTESSTMRLVSFTRLRKNSLRRSGKVSCDAYRDPNE